MRAFTTIDARGVLSPDVIREAEPPGCDLDVPSSPVDPPVPRHARMGASFLCVGFRDTLRPMSAASADRLVRYLVDGAAHHGLERADGLERLDGAPWEGGRPTGRRDPLAAPRLAPCTPA